MLVMNASNEGKACDAVIRRLEAQYGFGRQEVRYPEKENHPAPVEVVCSIGGQRFAFEHTIIEPFERHIQGQAQDWKELPRFRDKLTNFIPEGEHIVLCVPVRCLAGLDSTASKQVQEGLFNFVESQIESLPAHPSFSGIVPHEFNIPEISFKFSLVKYNGSSIFGRISLIQKLNFDLEMERVKRTRRALDKKSTKLSHWKCQGFRAVLVLEENDIALTDVVAVATCLRNAEVGLGFRSDEIYLFTAKMDDPCLVWPLRIDDRYYSELAKREKSMTTFDPRTLNDITRR